MKFNLKKDEVNSRVDEILSSQISIGKTIANNSVDFIPDNLLAVYMNSSTYISLVMITDRTLPFYDVEYEYHIENLDESDICNISFTSRASNVLLKMPYNNDLNCLFDSIDYGVIINSEISFAQRNNLEVIFKTSAHCCSNPVDIILTKLICDSVILKKEGI